MQDIIRRLLQTCKYNLAFKVQLEIILLAYSRVTNT
jgi:hypothetical protein